MRPGASESESKTHTVISIKGVSEKRWRGQRGMTREVEVRGGHGKLNVVCLRVRAGDSATLPSGKLRDGLKQSDYG